MDDLGQIRDKLKATTPGESITYSKTDQPDLPPEFTRTHLGTPNWIAQPGATAQYRAAPALHAYELDQEWKIHRDRYDPRVNPAEHVFFDAPELPIAAFVAILAGALTYWILDRWERDEDQSERSPWIPVIVAIAVAALVGLFVYVLAALVRVSLGIE